MQNRVVFGSSTRFEVSMNGEIHWISGGVVSQILLTRVGKIELKASIDGYSSPAVKLKIRNREVVSLAIVPPSDRSERLFGLFLDRENYLGIEILGRTKVR